MHKVYLPKETCSKPRLMRELNKSDTFLFQPPMEVCFSYANKNLVNPMSICCDEMRTNVSSTFHLLKLPLRKRTQFPQNFHTRKLGETTVFFAVNPIDT